MKLHESGLFYCKYRNGFYTSKLPDGVKCFRVYRENGEIINDFQKRVFYLKGMTTLEVELLNGTCRFFQYDNLLNKLIDVNEWI